MIGRKSRLAEGCEASVSATCHKDVISEDLNRRRLQCQTTTNYSRGPIFLFHFERAATGIVVQKKKAVNGNDVVNPKP